MSRRKGDDEGTPEEIERRLKSRLKARRWHARQSPERILAKGREKVYKVSLEGQLRLLRDQGERCAVCGNPITLESCVFDHDHGCCPPRGKEGGKWWTCGKCLRGLLCPACNSAVGHLERLGDPHDYAMRLVAYLERRPVRPSDWTIETHCKRGHLRRMTGRRHTGRLHRCYECGRNKRERAAALKEGARRAETQPFRVKPRARPRDAKQMSLLDSLVGDARWTSVQGTA